VSPDQIILLVVVIVIAAMAVTLAYSTSMAARGKDTRPSPEPAAGATRGTADPVDPSLGTAPMARTSTSFITPASTRQVARVVALLFLAAVAVVVALTGAWQENVTAIFTLIAGGTLPTATCARRCPSASSPIPTTAAPVS
jgi:hypothetical protein